jgi:hypothetical protein
MNQAETETGKNRKFEHNFVPHGKGLAAGERNSSVTNWPFTGLNRPAATGLHPQSNECLLTTPVVCHLCLTRCLDEPGAGGYCSSWPQLCAVFSSPASLI